jgi:hypothetical protein
MRPPVLLNSLFLCAFTNDSASRLGKLTYAWWVFIPNGRTDGRLPVRFQGLDKKQSDISFYVYSACVISSCLVKVNLLHME